MGTLTLIGLILGVIVALFGLVKAVVALIKYLKENGLSGLISDLRDWWSH